MTRCTPALYLAILGLITGTACARSPSPAPSRPDPTPYVIDTRSADGALTGARVVHDDGSGRWLAAVEIEPGVFRFAPGGDAVSYGLVCPRDAAVGPRTGVHFFHEVASDARHVDVPCIRYTEDRKDFEVTVIPGESELSARRSGSYNLGGPEPHGLSEEPGPSDLIATTDTRALIRRAVMLPPASPLVLDINRDGRDLVAVPVIVPPAAAGETVDVSYTFVTAGDTSAVLQAMEKGAGTVLAMPQTLTQAGDRHEIEVSAADGPRRRFVVVRLESLATAATIPPFGPAIANVEVSWISSVQVRWTGRPDGDTNPLRIAIDQDGDPSRDPDGDPDNATARTWTASFSAARLALDHQSRDGSWIAPDLSRVAGWDPGWSLDRAALARATWVVEDHEPSLGQPVRRGSQWSAPFAKGGPYPVFPSSPQPVAHR